MIRVSTYTSTIKLIFITTIMSAYFVLAPSASASALDDFSDALLRFQNTFEEYLKDISPVGEVLGVSTSPYNHVGPSDVGVNIGNGVIAPKPTQRYTGSLTIKSPTTIENKIIDGCLRIDSDNVTIKNNDINCSGLYPIKTEPGASNVSITYNDITCNGNSKIFYVSDGAPNLLISHNVAEGCDDFFYLEGDVDNMRVLYNYMHTTRASAASHSDGFQFGTFIETTGDILVKGNYFDPNNDDGGETGLVFSSRYGTVNLTLEDNYIEAWGTHVIRCGDSTCKVQNNIFADSLRDFGESSLLLYQAKSSTDSFSCNRHPNGDFVAEIVDGQDRINDISRNISNCPAFTSNTQIPVVTTNEPEPEPEPEPEEEEEEVETPEPTASEDTTDDESDTEDTDEESESEDTSDDSDAVAEASVQTTDTLRVREKPYGDIVGVQRRGSTGKQDTSKSSTEVRGYKWVYVDFDNGADGYVANKYITKTEYNKAEDTEDSLEEWKKNRTEMIRKLYSEVQNLRSLFRLRYGR